MTAVLSPNASDPSPTNAGVVDYVLRFSAPVSGIDASQFTLTSADLTGAVTNPAGTLQIDTIGPQVASFTASDPLLTSTNVVHYTLTFSEPVTGVNANAFSLTSTGVNGASIASVTPVGGSNGAQYIVTVNTGTGDGAIAVEFSGAGIQDLTGNPLPGGTFQLPISYVAGDAPFSVAVGDLNGDSKPDLVTANVDSNSVSVLLGNGNGTFQAKADYATGFAPYAVAVEDLDGDGKLDVVTVNLTSNTVSVLLGNGNGTFQAKTDYATQSRPHSVAVRDLNGDGKPDLVVANSDSSSNTVSVLLGTGNGTFQPQTTYATGSRPYSVDAGDLNGDGKPDLVTANIDSNSVSVLLGNGNGTFQSQTTYATGASPIFVAIGDLNGDGKPDVVTANYMTSNTVSVLLGNGDGSFQAQTTYVTGPGSASVAISDVNGDGKPDLVTANANSDTVSVLFGNGNGTFQPQISYPAAGNPFSIAIADLNGDSRPDLVVANTGPGTVSVLLNNPPTLRGSTYTIDKTAPTVAIGIIAADDIVDASEANAGFAIGGTTVGDENGQTVTVTIVNAANSVVGTYLTTVSNNAWSLTVPASDAKALPDGSYTVKANVSDLAGNPAPQATHALTVDETGPTITSNGGGDAATVSVPENSTTVTTVTATDPDAMTTLTYSIVGGADAIRFQINALTGELSFIAAPNFESPTDSDHNNSYIVQVRASEGTLFDNQTLTVNVTDVNEAPTAVVLFNKTASIAENTATATHIKVADIAVTDDALGTNTLGLTGADAALFEIVGSSLFLKAGTVLDFESKTGYVVAVTVDDTSVGGTPDATSAIYTLAVTSIGKPAIDGVLTHPVGQPPFGTPAGDGTPAHANVAALPAVAQTPTGPPANDGVVTHAAAPGNMVDISALLSSLAAAPYHSGVFGADFVGADASEIFAARQITSSAGHDNGPYWADIAVPGDTMNVIVGPYIPTHIVPHHPDWLV
jgi:FG-GAP-like repeat/Bacterial Ig-like domain/Cadherin domain